MRTTGRIKLVWTVVLVAAACSGATSSLEEGQQAPAETTVPEILANVADDGSAEGMVDEASTPTSAVDGTTTESALDPVLPPPTTSADGQSSVEQPPASSSESTAITAATTTSTITSTTGSTTGSTTPTVVPVGDGFLPPGAVLPSDAECEARVTPTAAVRAANATPNARRGGPALSGPEFERVTGNMSGTTDEILQWAACKWGLPADVARAQAATETWWRQGFLGDWTTTAADCAPGHSLGSGGRPGECPQSIGLLQIKYKFFKEAFPGASESTAYSVDYAYAVWRNCYEGRQGWLNDSERGRDYTAGDAWGCIGRWFAGQWYTQPATDYIGHVRDALESKVWTSADFIAEG